MDPRRGTLGFLLFLLNPLNLCFAIQKVFLEKRIWSDADMTPVCANETDTFITTIYCKVDKRNSASVCSLAFLGQRFVNYCDSRITLTSQNQTVFLHLKDLTPEDSGMYNCVCNEKGGSSNLYLNITVEAPVNERGKADDTKETTKLITTKTDINIIILFSSITACVLICGVIVSCIYKRICCRRQPQPAVREGEEMDTYAALQQPNTDLYQTIVKVDSAGASVSKHQRLHRGDYGNVKEFAN